MVVAAVAVAAQLCGGSSSANVLCQREFGPGAVGNGQAIIAAGMDAAIPDSGIVAALTAALAETNLVGQVADVPAEADDRWVGVLLLGPDAGAQMQRRDPYTAAATFYRSLTAHHGWRELIEQPALAAVTVQRSAAADLYRSREAEAEDFYERNVDAVASSGCDRDRGRR